MPELTLTEIWIYPIKSLGGISLTKSKVFEKGLQYDRRWMLVDSDGKFMTQRNYPELALLKVAFEGEELVITHNKKHKSHRIPLRPEITEHLSKAIVWKDTVKIIEVNNFTNNWFSELLEISCKLVFFPESNERLVDPQYASSETNVSLADGFPFLIIGESSLNNLNQRLINPVPMNRFRPNFVFKGGEAFIEDSFKEFSIGNNRFLGVKPCSRCVLTTVNQDTADKGIEPLQTLALYRKINNKIYFGQNLLTIDQNEVSIGDVLTFPN
ncbi:MOSC domain-containing protein [Leptospira sp. 96542]|nr:MOSC domain-containing protein [Leptospira sp. 96542]